MIQIIPLRQPLRATVATMTGRETSTRMSDFDRWTPEWVHEHHSPIDMREREAKRAFIKNARRQKYTAKFHLNGSQCTHVRSERVDAEVILSRHHFLLLPADERCLHCVKNMEK